MAQAWYQKASVQSAIVAGLCLIIAALCVPFLESFGLKKKNIEISATLSNAQVEIQRLETLLTPFRTIALDKYTGNEREALNQLAERMNELEELNIRKSKELDSLKNELQKVSKKAEPVILSFGSLEVSKDEQSIVTTMQFLPSKNINAGVLEFMVQLPAESDVDIINIWPTLSGGPYSTGKDSFRVSENKKTAHLGYQLLGVGRPTFEIRTSDFTLLKVSGSHLGKALIIDNKTKGVQPVD